MIKHKQGNVYKEQQGRSQGDFHLEFTTIFEGGRPRDGDLVNVSPAS